MQDSYGKDLKGDSRGITATSHLAARKGKVMLLYSQCEFS